MPTNERYKIFGQAHYIEISFPWEQGEVIRVDLFSLDGKRLETWMKPIPAEILRRYWPFIGAAKNFVSKLFGQ